MELGYISFENEQYSLCDEVKYLVAKCYTNESKGGLEVRDKIINYCNVFAELYEIVPLDKVFEIYDKQNHDISKEDFMDFSSNINPFGSSKLAKKYVVNKRLFIELSLMSTIGCWKAFIFMLENGFMGIGP